MAPEEEKIESERVWRRWGTGKKELGRKRRRQGNNGERKEANLFLGVFILLPTLCPAPRFSRPRFRPLVSRAHASANPIRPLAAHEVDMRLWQSR